MKNLIFPIILLCIPLLFSCKPDLMEIEVYTSDVQSAGDGEILEVPLKATFKLMGEDKDGQLAKAVDIAKKYLSEDSEFSEADGTFGKVLSIVTTAPIGTKKALINYMKKNPRPLMLEVSGNKITLKPGKSLKTLNSELSDINFMLGAKLPAESTIFRITSDSKKKATVSAIAVFSEKKPYLNYEKSIKRRKSVEIEFKGGGGSVYSAIDPIFSITL